MMQMQQRDVTSFRASWQVVILEVLKEWHTALQTSCQLAGRSSSFVCVVRPKRPRSHRGVSGSWQTSVAIIFHFRCLSKARWVFQLFFTPFCMFYSMSFLSNTCLYWQRVVIRVWVVVRDSSFYRRIQWIRRSISLNSAAQCCRSL